MVASTRNEQSEMDVKMTLPPANEITLFCGVYRLAKKYSVVTRLDENVNSVRAKLGEKLDVPPHKLRLYLAKNDDGWLKADKNLDIFLSRGPMRTESGDTEFEEIWPSQLLSSHFGQQIPDCVVNVLVEVKQNLKRRETDVEAPPALKARKTSTTLRTLIPILNLGDLKARAFKSGDLPKDGDFLKLLEWDNGDCGKVNDIQAIGDIVGFTGSKFYVRKETLCVLENFKQFLQVKLGTTTEKFRKEQFIFMGSPGTGKSCLLALICFYLAIEKNVRVVWHRSVQKEDSETRLFHQGKNYEWIDEAGSTYLTIIKTKIGGGFDPASCWFCIDGLNQEQLARTNFGTAFTLLATSGQFEKKGESGAKQITCLVPYCRLDDLKDLGGKCRNLNESDVAGQLFVSGGSLRDFLLPKTVATNAVDAALRKLDADGAELC